MKKYIETHRIDENRVRVSTHNGMDITLFANKDVPVDRASLRETTGIASIQDTIEILKKDGFLDSSSEISRAVLTPDFHKGSGIPVGTVLDAKGFIIPKCIGRDINCSMRFIATDLSEEDFKKAGSALDNRLRHLFFAGGRNIAMNEVSREGIMRHGLMGLDIKNMPSGLWDGISDDVLDHDILRTHNGGSWNTDNNWMFDDFIKGSGGISRDSALGSIGGGNHFVEFQAVNNIFDRKTAYEWGIKPGTIGIMIHSGSLFAGQTVGDHYMDVARSLYPSHLERPEHDFYPLPLIGKDSHHAKAYLNALGLASNFAVLNRMLMGYMAIQAIRDIVKSYFSHHLVYDLSHNMLFKEGENHFIHRKGASPSDKTEFFHDGHPVIIPGSMGTSSFIMKGGSNADALKSAPHGAGRLLSRGNTRQSDRGEKLRIVTKVDMNGLRKDIQKEVFKDLMEEAPDAYKPVLPAFHTVRNSGMASAVAEMTPIMTVKG